MKRKDRSEKEKGMRRKESKRVKQEREQKIKGGKEEDRVNWNFLAHI